MKVYIVLDEGEEYMRTFLSLEKAQQYCVDHTVMEYVKEGSVEWTHESSIILKESIYRMFIKVNNPGWVNDGKRILNYKILEEDAE